MRLYPIVVVLPEEYALFQKRQFERRQVFFCATEECREEVIQIARRHNSAYFLPAVDEGLSEGMIRGGSVAANHRALRMLLAPGVAPGWVHAGSHELIDLEGKPFGRLEVL